MGKRTRPLLGLTLLLLLVTAAYFPALSGDFVYDDLRFIVKNPFMEGEFDWADLFLDPGVVDGGRNPDIYRPLRTAVFYFEHRLGSGSPLVHHLAGLMIHLANTLLVWVLIRRLFSHKETASPFLSPAWAGAALFALHPVQVESVAWISSRGDQLCIFFLLLTLIHVLGSGKGPLALRLAGTVILTILACLSKETAVITGGLILLASFCLKNFRSPGIRIHGLLSLAAACCYLFLRSQALGSLESQTLPHGGTPGTNLIYACFGMAYQASLIFRPWFSNLDYQDGFFDALPLAGVMAGGFLYLAFITTLIFLFRRQGYAPFALLFFLMAQFPTSSLVFTLRSLVNDRYLYLPMVGAAILTAAWCGAAERRSTQGGPLFRIACLACVLALSGLSFDRACDWQDRERLWTATLETHPESIRARNGLSNFLLDRGDWEEALPLAEEAGRQARPGTSLHRDACYAAARALEQAGRFQEAAARLRQALADGEDDPDLPILYRNLWSLEMKTRQYARALSAAEALMSREGENWENLLLAGLALQSLGRLEEAREALERGAALDSAREEIHFALAELYRFTGEIDKAGKAWERGKQLEKEAGIE